ncbi:MAG TPA: amidohydrolase family protein [Xanthomonadales bacterium]|nr:amidohydrolase family protein [Xanthomonadales bacterium]
MIFMPNVLPRARALLMVAAWSVLVAACGGDTATPQAPAPQPADATTANNETTTRYDWYMEGATPAGQSVVTQTGDGRITSESFIHWNNREYRLDSEIQLDGEGRVIAQRITGTSPFGAPVDESFSFENGVAAWSTIGQKGSALADEPAWYLPNESGVFASLPALVRAAALNLDGEVPMFPSGKAKVERVTEAELETGAGMQRLVLYAISGIDFSPNYAWFDQHLELVALDWGGYLGMIPQGWSADTLRQLSEIQTSESARRSARMAGELATIIEAPLIFENVDVVDVERGVLLPQHQVLVIDGRIAAVSGQAIDHSDAVRIDGTGQSLMPGMWDMHGHFSLGDGLLNIAGGITSVRDIGNVHEKIVLSTEKFNSGEVIGPNTYRAGFIDKAGPYASGWPAETLEDALQRVDFFAANGYIQIKLYSSIVPSWVAPIAERAHARGMRVSGHIPAFMSAEQAVRAGYDEIQHINMVFLNFLAGDRMDTRQQIRFTLYGDEAANLDLDSPAVEDFIRLLQEKNTVIDATAAIFETMLVHQPGMADPTYTAVAEHLPIAVRRGLYTPDMVPGENWPASAQKQSQMLKKLYDSGVQLVPGSDGIAAFTLHRELEVYVEAGIPAAAVLKMATLDAARVVGVEQKTGSITVGKDADLVLVDGNPLQDISAVRRATLVMKGKTAYRPDLLYQAAGVQPFVPSVEL